MNTIDKTHQMTVWLTILIQFLGVKTQETLTGQFPTCDKMVFCTHACCNTDMHKNADSAPKGNTGKFGMLSRVIKQCICP